MPLHAEDVYEDLDEADDEDIEDALGEDSDFSERRRRRGRNRARGGGYNKPKIEKSFVTQQQLQQVSERVAKDIRAVDANVKALEAATKRGQNNVGQSMQMMALLPMLMKKTATVDASGNLPNGTKVVIDDGDMFTMMLPMMMMMQSNPSTTNGQSQGGMDPMMMMMMVMIMNDRPKTGTT